MTIDTFTVRAARFTAVLDGASPEGWDAPTPCAGWTVRDVVAHVVTTERDFLVRQDLPAGPEPDLADPAAAWGAHRDAMTATLASDGVRDRSFDGYFGPTTIGATMADFYGWDLAIHAWDVAAATGQDLEIDDTEAAVLSATADGWGAMLHSEGICADPVDVPADASAGDRLLGRLGRDPGWRSSAGS